MQQGFDVIKQFDQMRQSLTPQLSPIAPVEVPKIDVDPYRPPTGMLAAPQSPSAGHFQGDGHNHDRPSGGAPAKPGAAAVGPLKLVSWRGRQIDASVMDKAEALARQFPGLRLTSAYRDPQTNARTPGAAKNSWHMKGRAVDFGGSAKDMAAGAAWARKMGAREVLVHNAGTGQHLHVAW